MRRAFLLAGAALAGAAQGGGPTRLMTLGDSITYGCGGRGMPPIWALECGPLDGSYRAPLYRMLRDTGFTLPAGVANASLGNASFQFVGCGPSNGPIDVPPLQLAHCGVSGIGLAGVIHNAPTWGPVGADFVLLHLGVNDVERVPLPVMVSNLTTLLTLIRVYQPNATTVLASIVNPHYNDIAPPLPPNSTIGPLEVGAYNAALPGVVAAAVARGQRVVFADVNKRSNWCRGDAGEDAPPFPCTGVHPTVAGYAGMAMAFFEVLAPLLPLPGAVQRSD